MSDSNKEGHHVYGSECCKKALIPLDEACVVNSAPGSMDYYYSKCGECGAPCHSVLTQLFDSTGAEVLAGHLLHCPESSGLAWEYHAVFERNGHIEVRDLGHNNTGMYFGRFFAIGPYWEHLDKLSDEDLDYYWNTTRADACRKLERR